MRTSSNMKPKQKLKANNKNLLLVTLVISLASIVCLLQIGLKSISKNLISKNLDVRSEQENAKNGFKNHNRYRRIRNNHVKTIPDTQNHNLKNDSLENLNEEIILSDETIEIDNLNDLKSAALANLPGKNDTIEWYSAVWSYGKHVIWVPVLFICCVCVCGYTLIKGV